VEEEATKAPEEHWEEEATQVDGLRVEREVQNTNPVEFLSVRQASQEEE